MIDFDVLGEVGKDNCVAARVVTGTSMDHLLLDCGGNCLHALPNTTLRDTTAVFFSHFHFDHFAGFDELIRNTWCREGPLLEIFGPPETCRIIQQRLQGFIWNNAVGLPGGYRVSEFDGEQLRTVRLLTTEKFAVAHEEVVRKIDGPIFESEHFFVNAIVLEHNGPCIGYLIREPEKQSVDIDVLNRRGWVPGPWTRKLKDPEFRNDEMIEIGSSRWNLGNLRDECLREVPGDSLGYLTDFRLNCADVRKRLVEMFRGIHVLICENNYRNQELELAQKNFHLTSREVGQLAAEIGPGELVVFHVSDRYLLEELAEQLEQVRAHFPLAKFPPHWKIPSAP